MKFSILIANAILCLAFAAPSNAKSASNPMGIALGNELIGDYGAEGKVTAMFNRNGTVALTFPDGTKANQRWVADSNFFCMIAAANASGKMGYRCERNLIAGHKLGESWQQVDSEGKTATITVRERSR